MPSPTTSRFRARGDTDVPRLQAVLRDLVALSDIPCAGVTRAESVADALVRMLELDFVFVRLGDAASATRGEAWPGFRKWLRYHARLARVERVEGEHLAVPIGRESEGGLVFAGRRQRGFPDATDELLLTHVANLLAGRDGAETERERLAGEQAALRRVATLVARDASPAEVFAAIAEELGRLMGVEHVRMWRFENADAATTVASAGTFDRAMPVGVTEPLYAYSLAGRVSRTGRSQRVDDYAEEGGPGAVRALQIGMRCGVATPIVVEGRLWGAMVAASRQARGLPADTATQMDQFTELMATAIGNTEARGQADRLATEQAALRRVAMLVATEASPAEVFAKVAEELASVLDDVDCWLFRDEGDGTATMVALWDPSLSGPSPLGERSPIDGNGVIASVLREGRPSRIDDNSEVTGAIGLRGRDELGVRSAVGCPIVVRGHVWGAMAAASHAPHAFPPDTETRLARFAELAATAVVNAEARAEVARLADEQAALRRVAMLVAEGGSATAVFDAVAAEMARLLGAGGVLLGRYEPGDVVVVVAHRGKDADKLEPGTHIHHEPESVSGTVRRTERPARVESYAYGEGEIHARAADFGISGAVGAPIVVDGRLWGVTVATWRDDEQPPPGTEQRMAQFAELLDTAIANADSRDQLTASRARLLTAADEARRRVVRDLHDGAQQRLLHSMLALQLAQQSLREGDGREEALVAEALQHARQGNTELRELAHGLLPSALAQGGLRAGIDAVVARLDLPVRLEVPGERFPEEIERSAYFIIAEALTNVVKHAQATLAEVTVSAEGDMLRVAVRDDGAGGADPEGHGLVGLADRATALGGRLTVESAPGAGTTVVAELPLLADG